MGRISQVGDGNGGILRGARSSDEEPGFLVDPDMRLVHVLDMKYDGMRAGPQICRIHTHGNRHGERASQPGT